MRKSYGKFLGGGYLSYVGLFVLFLSCQIDLFRYGKRSVASGEGQIHLHLCTFVMDDGLGGSRLCGARHSGKFHSKNIIAG